MKCPICNAKVAFSLPMHMHMVHGPGSKLEDNGGLPVEPEAPHGAMNQMRVVPPAKPRRRGKIIRRRR